MKVKKLEFNKPVFKKQSGAVLVMALVMLAVMTLIGVSAMTSSSIELKISSNSQEHEIAFQSAQTIIAFLISDDPANPVDYFDIGDDAQIVDYPLPGVTPAEIGVSGQAQINWMGCAAGLGDSLEEGKGQKFNFYSARVTGYNKATADASTSNSVQVQGTRFVAAGC